MSPRTTRKRLGRPNTFCLLRCCGLKYALELAWSANLDRMQFHLERLGGGLHDAIIILSAWNDQDTVKRAFSLDALGFIPKTSRPEVMLNAIQLVLSGDLYIPAEILDGQEPTSARVSNKLSAREFQDDLGLTARQIEVLGLLSIA